MKLLFSLFVLVLFTITSCVMEKETQSPKEILYVGTYTDKGGQGIYVLEFERAEGKFTMIQVVREFDNPSFLAIHPSGKFLYAVHEAASEYDENSGTVSAYSIDPATGMLSLINSQLSMGGAPCHISIDKTGSLAFVSNYSGGSVVVFPIHENGQLCEPGDIKQHEGSSINKERQQSPHVHSAILSPSNNSIMVSDLGTDKVYHYNISFDEKSISPADTPYAQVDPGSGPRHLVFHPSANHAYLVEELTSSVGVFNYDKSRDILEFKEGQISSLPRYYAGENKGADIHLDPEGKFLFVSNRGHNSIAVFSVDTDGGLTPKGHYDVKGNTPRNFLVDPKGELLFVANQDSDNIVVFKMDKTTGGLTDTGIEASIPAPVCILILEL